MSSTDKRQITFLVKGILEKHRIDSLVLEVDLVCAFDRYVVGRRAGKDISQLRIEILEDMSAGNERAAERDEMEERIKRCLGINPRTTPALWDSVIHFLIKVDKKNETIERFASACEADPYNMPKSHQIANKPTLIQAMWPKVFKGEIVPAIADSDGGYR